MMELMEEWVDGWDWVDLMEVCFRAAEIGWFLGEKWRVGRLEEKGREAVK
jgi:hypothetical protein